MLFVLVCQCPQPASNYSVSPGHGHNKLPHPPSPFLINLAFFPMPKLGVNIRVLRDIKARQGVKDNEVVRRAYLFVARNQALPPQVRYQAQLQLNTFGRYTRPTTVKNRCVESGRGRGIISEFGLSRVRDCRFFGCCFVGANVLSLLNCNNSFSSE